MGISFRQSALKVWGAIHATWIIAGITLLMLVVVEVAVRALRPLPPKGVEAAIARGDPQAHMPWFADYNREFDETRAQDWRSYVYWGRKPNYKGKTITLDSAGHRVTPQPMSSVPPVARVWFFGGSTMWGTGERDDHTIAAEAARRLQDVAGPGQRIEVRNFGESGYVMTQEMLSLMVALRGSERPDVVVFYDGINDVGTAVQYGQPGIPQNESKRVTEFALGRAIDRSGYERGIGHDMKAWGALGNQAVQQLALVDWVRSLKPVPAPTYISADSATHSTARVYAETARIISAMGQAYGFTPVFVWQPTLHGTRKALTPFETRLMKRIDRDPFERRIKETQLAIPPLLDSAMAAVAPGRFVNESQLFTGDTLSVFVDHIGHTTEASVPKIVDGFWPTLRSAVEQHRAARGTLASARTPQRTN